PNNLLAKPTPFSTMSTILVPNLAPSPAMPACTVSLIALNKPSIINTPHYIFKINYLLNFKIRKVYLVNLHHLKRYLQYLYLNLNRYLLLPLQLCLQLLLLI